MFDLEIVDFHEVQMAVNNCLQHGNRLDYCDLNEKEKVVIYNRVKKLEESEVLESTFDADLFHNILIIRYCKRMYDSVNDCDQYSRVISFIYNDNEYLKIEFLEDGFKKVTQTIYTNRTCFSGGKDLYSMCISRNGNTGESDTSILFSAFPRTDESIENDFIEAFDSICATLNQISSGSVISPNVVDNQNIIQFPKSLIMGMNN